MRWWQGNWLIKAALDSKGPPGFQTPLVSESWLCCSVQSLSCARLFATPWTAACQASLSITNSWSLLKLMSIKSVMPSNHLILCRPLLLLPQSLPASESFPMSQFFASDGQSTGVSASASVLSMNIQENVKHYFVSMWEECNCVVVWAFFGIAFLWDWN